jgi:DNA topoisomerase IB
MGRPSPWAAAKYQDKKEVPKADGKGTTTVYEYSERQVANRHREKAERIEKLRGNLHNLRSRVKRDLKSKDPKTRLCALAVGLMNDTYERVGNEESAKNGHVGVTGWSPEHVKFGNGKATFTYVGKSGVSQEKTTTDADLIRVLREAVKGKSKGDTLFVYEDGKVDAAAVNEYLEDLGLGITAKDIRGLHANREMQERLKSVRSKGGNCPKDKKKREKKLKDEFEKALKGAAEAVGHEPATLKSQYLVPGLEDTYLKDGTVMQSLKKKGSTLEKTASWAAVKRFFPGNSKATVPRHNWTPSGLHCAESGGPEIPVRAFQLRGRSRES